MCHRAKISGTQKHRENADGHQPELNFQGREDESGESVNAEFHVGQDNAITRNILAIKFKKEGTARALTKWKRFFMFSQSLFPKHI
jgi:hypothetical protein